MSTLTFLLPEHHVAGKPLGRHVEHDPRSRAYALDTSGLTLQTVRHARRTPIIDQGDLGCCTGCAITGALGTDPFYETVPAGTLPLDVEFAKSIYSAATHVDSVPGVWPPTDTGSTGLAVAKVAKSRGLISGYLHTFALQDALKALTLTPLIAGIGWYDSFDQPDATGLVSISPDAQVRGGHEIEAMELVVDGPRVLVGFDNSWGSGFGVEGRFYMSADTFGTLLGQQGDVVVPVPLTSTPPNPKPPTPATADDLNLWVAMKAWAKAKGLS